MDLGLEGKVALVSGASKGIGREIARQLASEGVRVVLAARGQQGLKEAAEQLEAAGGLVEAVVADMTKKDDVERAVAAGRSRFGRIDIAVSNVYPTHTKGFDTTGDDDFKHEFETLVMSVIYLTRAVLPDMKTHRGGRLINIGSLTMKGPVRGVPFILSDVMRPGVVGLNKSLSHELGSFGITVNNIAVGWTRTERFRQSYERRTKSTGMSWQELEAKSAQELHIPLGRLGTPEEVGSLAVYLCSERAGYISGQTIVIDGGKTGGLF